jgi:hypothetical protein
MEQWSNGEMGNLGPITPTLHYSITPLPRYARPI